MERFQNKKPNKGDHKIIRQVAKGIKNGAGAVGVVLLARQIVKEYGKDIVDFARNKILKI